jgi:hypothetical protein
MISELKSFLTHSNILQKALFVLLTLLPIALATSIFISDLIALLITTATIIILTKERGHIFTFNIFKWPIIIMILFYTIIIISLIYSVNFKLSFLPSIFYFRFFLMSWGIYYIIKHSEFTLHALLYSLLAIFFLIIFDSIIQYTFDQNIFGYELQAYHAGDDALKFITSFFNEEKKLGSFVIRILPLILSLIIYLDLTFFKKNHIDIVIIFLTTLIILYSSERTPILMLIVFFTFYLKILKNKFLIVSCLVSLAFAFLFISDKHFNKLINGSLAQLTIIEFHSDHKKQKKDFSTIKYYSTEHQNLALTAFYIFKKSPLVGTGVKSYRESCKNTDFADFVCTTHPHSTYPQILSELGIFGFLLFLYVFLYIFYINIKIIINNNRNDNLIMSFYILNAGIIINLMPFMPTGSFFNNWISLMIFLPLGFWLYLFVKIKQTKIIR